MMTVDSCGGGMSVSVSECRITETGTERRCTPHHSSLTSHGVHSSNLNITAHIYMFLVFMSQIFFTTFQ